MSELTPREIVAELDRHIVGQSDAKRAVAIALRNRWRRKQTPEPLRGEITPKNILMIGPTGVGKTEVSRRLAKLANAPFLKVEATKFTEVGYFGRDVEQIVRDLVEAAVGMVRETKRAAVADLARDAAEERLLDAVRMCFASLFKVRAISYRIVNGFDHFKVVSQQGVVQVDLLGDHRLRLDDLPSAGAFDDPLDVTHGLVPVGGDGARQQGHRRRSRRQPQAVVASENHVLDTGYGGNPRLQRGVGAGQRGLDGRAADGVAGGVRRSDHRPAPEPSPSAP